MQQELLRNFGSTSSCMQTPWVHIFDCGWVGKPAQVPVTFRYGIPVGNTSDNFTRLSFVTNYWAIQGFLCCQFLSVLDHDEYINSDYVWIQRKKQKEK